MARDREFLPIFLDFNDTTQDLTDEQCGRLIRALVAYANGMEYEIAGVELIAFRFLKGYIDRNRVLSEKRAEAGSKGGQQTAANNAKRQQEEANISKYGNNSYSDSNGDIVTNSKGKKNQFFPPTIEEVAAYIKEHGYAIDPERFIDYYQTRGWEMRPGQKMKDWKAAVRTWAKNQKERGWSNDVSGSRPENRVPGQRDLYDL